MERYEKIEIDVIGFEANDIISSQTVCETQDPWISPDI